MSGRNSKGKKIGLRTTIYNIYSKNNNRLAQSTKSASSKKRRNERDIVSTLPHSEFPAITSTFSGLAILVSVLLGFLGFNNTYATDSYISISLTGNVSLNLLKDNTNAVFGKSTEARATVTSDHFTGYTLTIAGSNDTGKLENNDKSKFLSSIDTAISENTFKTNDTYNNKWGFLPSKYNSVDNNQYQPSPIHSTETTIDVTNSPTDNNGNNYTLALGAKVSPSMALDSYGQTFVLAATGNGYDYHIGYSDVMDTLPADDYGTTSDSSVEVSATIPVRSGYTFGGWCDAVPTVSLNGTTCPAGANIYNYSDEDHRAITLDGTTANNIELYAIWNAITFADAFGNTAMTMQNMTTAICNSVAVGQEGTLVDNRSGNKTYNVGKMRDGKCWMLDNLALGGSSAISLTPNDTNITANWTLPASVTSGFDTYTEARVNTTDINTISPDGMSSQPQNQWKIGAYYNYCAASAGSHCPASDAAAEPGNRDICPKGWRMPSGGPGGEYQVIYNAYTDGNNNYADFRTALKLPLSGYYNSTQVYDQGGVGYWWSSTFSNGNNMYRLRANTSSIAPQGASIRYVGLSMRCVAK